MIPRKVALARRLESRIIDVERHRIHVRSSSSAPPAEAQAPIVLVHGLVISSLYMVPTALRLMSTFELYAPDLPGFGLSSKPDRVLSIAEHALVLARLVEALELAPAVWVGNSYGCQVIAEVAVRSPSIVRAAVLAGPTMDAAARSAPRQIGRWLIDSTRERPSLAAAHVRDYWKAGVPRALATFRDALADPIEEKLVAIAAPVLVVRGGRDAIVPARWAEECLRLLPHGELATIEGGPHCVNYTTPEAFSRVVSEFVRRL